MIVTHATGHELGNAGIALVFLAMGIVMFWRIVLRVLLAAVIVAVGIGVFVLFQAMHA
jgi:hypothetical protein